MLCKKVLAPPSPERFIRKELEYLYCRRVTVEMLIRSLERYDRFKQRHVECKRRSA
jgi:hypothetical protein